MMRDCDANFVDDPQGYPTAGDLSAAHRLLGQHRHRLRRMVAVHLDPRMAARIDPSDVVQEAMMQASAKLPEYLREQPLPFYPWLRQIAWERLVHLHTRHVHAQKRTVKREVCTLYSDHSAGQLADRLVTSRSGPRTQAIRQELRQRTRAALDQLDERDREVLVLRYLEQLKITEIAAVLGITQTAATMRHLRALQRFGAVLGSTFG